MRRMILDQQKPKDEVFFTDIVGAMEPEEEGGSSSAEPLLPSLWTSGQREERSTLAVQRLQEEKKILLTEMNHHWKVLSTRRDSLKELSCLQTDPQQQNKVRVPPEPLDSGAHGVRPGQSYGLQESSARSQDDPPAVWGEPADPLSVGSTRGGHRPRRRSSSPLGSKRCRPRTAEEALLPERAMKGEEPLPGTALYKELRPLEEEEPFPATSSPSYTPKLTTYNRLRLQETLRVRASSQTKCSFCGLRRIKETGSDIALRTVFIEDTTPLEAEDIYRAFGVSSLSVEGSNRRRMEARTTGSWRDWLQTVEGGERPLGLGDVLQFATGLDNPCGGLSLTPTLNVLHPEDGHAQFPTANTCAFVLRLPVFRQYEKSESPDKEFVLLVGASHLRSIVDGIVKMPEGRFSFGAMCTPGACATQLRTEAANAVLPRTPDAVYVMAPSNNLTSSRTITEAGEGFGKLLATAISRWPNVFALDFVPRLTVDPDYQDMMRQEFRRVAARMGVKYTPIAEYFPVKDLDLWSRDGVHLSDSAGMPILVGSIWNAAYMQLVPAEPTPSPVVHRRSPPARRVTPRGIVKGEVAKSPQPDPSKWTVIGQGRKRSQHDEPEQSIDALKPAGTVQQEELEESYLPLTPAWFSSAMLVEMDNMSPSHLPGPDESIPSPWP
ncbi:hypothetical protein KUCAC02_034462 [Chaenocephalus aceratus]|nr:hypothetical protein KUCAC02_034462 [Chaenocephalus aceratus]